MSIQRRLALSALALSTSMPASYAGPCTQEIDRMQARVDAMIDTAVGAGSMARESTAATMHRQPTPGSIAGAEEKLDKGKRAERALAAMTQARTADAANDKSACQRALEDVERAIGP
jgi:hypothetical protein